MFITAPGTVKQPAMHTDFCVSSFLLKHVKISVFLFSIKSLCLGQNMETYFCSFKADKKIMFYYQQILYDINILFLSTHFLL